MMMKNMLFDEMLEQYALEKFMDSALPDVASQALVEGLDSPTLRALSVSQGDYPLEIRKLFFQALDELGMVFPTPHQAALSAARRIARDIVSGRIEPERGAHRIWWEIWEDYRSLDMLTPFVGLASEYDDHPESRDVYTQDIIDYSNEFLAHADEHDAFVAALDKKLQAFAI